MRNLILFFLVFITISMTTAQQRATGLIFDDEAYNQVPHLPRYSGEKWNDVPIKYSLKAYCPTPFDQKLEASCTAAAVGYGAMTISAAIQEQITDRNAIDGMAFSIDYIFNQTAVDPDCLRGARLTDALELARNQGDCPKSAFEGTDNFPCSEKPGEEQHQIAKDYRIKEYSALFSFSDDPAVKVDKTIKAIADDKPVIIGMYVTRTFLMVQPGQEFWEPQENELPVGGGHAMVVTGYDYGKEAFEIMNSWGNGWGNDGFIWVKFEDFGRFCKYGFQMILEEKPTDVNVALTALKGTFEFQSFVGENEEGGYDFKVEPVVHQQGYRYELEQRQWETGGKGGFQLIAKDVPEGKYVYVFGIDPENEVEVFWPNQDELVERLEENEEIPEDIDALRKVKISSVVSSDRAEMIIPHEDYFLMLDKKGEDHLIVLYSDESIEDFDSRLEATKLADGTIEERLDAGFGDLLMKTEDLKFQYDKMNFVGACKKGEGAVVPMILTVEAI